MKRTKSWVLGSLVAVALVALACGDDRAPAAITITIGADSIDVPGEIEAGVIEVTIEGGDEDTTIEFTKVTPGATEAEFTEAMLTVIGLRGPIGEILEGSTGTGPGPGPTWLTLEPGPYFVWTEAPNGEFPPKLLVSEVTVSGEKDGELPDTDGTFVARDYGFDVDVGAGDTYTFSNDGPNQFHQAVLLNFGDLAPEVVEENLPAFVESFIEGAPPPEVFAGLDPRSVFDVGESGTFSPGFSGTFSASLESGTTYAVVCFMWDRAGGPPHAVAHNMFEAFRVP
jgi:hypothetical protein